MGAMFEIFGKLVLGLAALIFLAAIVNNPVWLLLLVPLLAFAVRANLKKQKLTNTESHK